MGRKGFVSGFVSGFVADTSRVDNLSEVRDNACLQGAAVLERTKLEGNAVVGGAAKISYSNIRGDSVVEGRAVLFNCVISDKSHIYGNVTLSNVNVFGNSCIFGNASLVSLRSGLFFPTLYGDCKFGGNATFEGLLAAEDFVRKYGADKVEVGGSFGSGRKIVALTDVWDMG